LDPRGRSGRGCNLAVPIAGTRTKPPPARTRRFVLAVLGTIELRAGVAADRRGKDVEGDAFTAAIATNGRAPVAVSAGLFTITIATVIGSVALGALAPFTALRTFTTLPTFAALRAFGAIGTLDAFHTLAGRAFRAILVTAIHLAHRFAVVHLVIEIVVVAIVATLPALLFEARAAFAEHPIIMVSELQIIFGLNPIAGKLGVPRHALVLFEELRRIATLAIVLAVAVRPAAKILRPLPSATTTPAALTIVDQIHFLQQKARPLAFQAGQAAHSRAALTLSFRQRERALSERPIASGVEREALFRASGRSGPGPEADVDSNAHSAKPFCSNPS
jgi:hypothetical protein